MPVTTIKASTRLLPEIIQGYSAYDIWSMDESGFFLKALPDTELAKKKKKGFKGGKKSKEGYTVVFLCPRVDSTYVNLLLLEIVKFRDAFKNCIILLNRMVCSSFTAKNHG